MARGTLRVEAGPANDPAGTRAVGRITFVDNAVDQTTGTIKIKGTFANEDRTLWPGQFVNVVVRLATESAAIVVPSLAVQTGPDGNYVYVVKADKTVELRPVTVARLAGAETVIKQGLDGRRLGGHRRPSAAGARQPRQRARRQRRKGGIMNFAELFIKRPITTTLIMLGIAVFGVMAYQLLPVSDLPTVDFPDHPGATPVCRAPARRPWHRPSRCRSKSSLRPLPASIRSTRRARKAAPTSRCSST